MLHKNIVENRRNRRYPRVSGYESGYCRVYEISILSFGHSIMHHLSQNVMLHKDLAENRQNRRYPGVSGYESSTAGRRFYDFVSAYFHSLVRRVCKHPQAPSSVLNKVLDLNRWKSWEIGRFGVVSGCCRSARWRIGLAKAYFKFRP